MMASCEVVKVTRRDADLAAVFLEHGRDYMHDIPADRREKFLQNMLDRQEEPDRWLLLFKEKDDYIGFSHLKIDRELRDGWGWIMEFYIRPEYRRKGKGTRFYRMCERILRENDVSGIWLTTNPEAKQFWCSLGFTATGERADFNDREIMEKR